MMVYGHTFGIIRNWVYLFHMPIFFMVSGYCWNGKHAATREAVQSYTFNRAARLIVPYYLCEIIFTLLNNAFLKLNFYTSNPAFLQMMGQPPVSQRIISYLSPAEVIIECYRQITFQKSLPQLASAIWFLYALCVICILHCWVVYITNKIQRPAVRKYIWVVVFLSLCILAWAMSKGYGEQSVALRHRQLFAGYLCYLTGTIARKEQVRFKPFLERFPYWQVYAGLFLLILCILNRIGRIDLSACCITHPGFLFFCLLCGWGFLYSISTIIGNSFSGNVFEYIGRHTLCIVFLHHIAFKLISALIVIKTGLPSFMIAAFPILFHVNEWMKILYTICGVMVPLIMERIYLAVTERNIYSSKKYKSENNDIGCGL